MVLAKRHEWTREVMAFGEPVYIRDLEGSYLTYVNAAADPMSFNKHNRSGKVVFKRGASNPMHDPEIKKRVIVTHTGDNHWTQRLNGKPNPQCGQKRPGITGDLHPNKKPENAAKISKSHTGKAHPYQIGDKNPMRRPEVVALFIGKVYDQVICSHCGKIGAGPAMHRFHFNNCEVIKPRIHKPMSTRPCEKCSREISLSNYKRHVDTCQLTGITNMNKIHPTDEQLQKIYEDNPITLRIGEKLDDSAMQSNGDAIRRIGEAINKLQGED